MVPLNCLYKLGLRYILKSEKSLNEHSFLCRYVMHMMYVFHKDKITSDTSDFTM